MIGEKTRHRIYESQPPIATVDLINNVIQDDKNRKRIRPGKSPRVQPASGIEPTIHGVESDQEYLNEVPEPQQTQTLVFPKVHEVVRLTSHKNHEQPGAHDSEGLRHQRKENTNMQELSDALQDLAQWQEMENQNTPNPIPLENSDLYAYLDDPRMQAIARELVNLPSGIHGSDDFSSRKRRADSRALEHIAYDQAPYLLNDSDQGVVVLDSAKTFDFYQMRFPHAEEVPDNFGLRGINGVSVPDYLAVKDGLISSVVEVTSTKTPDYFDKKLDTFRISKKMRHSFLYRHANLIFVVPSDFSQNLADSVAGQNPDSSFLFLRDITRNMVSDLVTRAYEIEYGEQEIVQLRTA